MFLMTGFPFKGSHILSAIPERQSLDMPFPRPGTGQADRLKVPVIHIQTCRKNLFYIDRFFPFVLNNHRAAQRIGALEDRIHQRNFHTEQTVPAENLKSTALRIFSPGSRKSLECRFTLYNLVAFITQFTCPVPLHASYTQRTLPVIPHSCLRILHGCRIQKCACFPLVDRGRKRRLIFAQQIPDIRVLKLSAIVEMFNITIIHYSDTITRIHRIK